MRYVLSWELSIDMDVDFCIMALERALTIGTPEIFNSDEGSQSTSLDFTKQLKQRSIQISMDSRGRAMDNIFNERLWRSVKYEEFTLKIIRASVRQSRESAMRGHINLSITECLLRYILTKTNKINRLKL